MVKVVVFKNNTPWGVKKIPQKGNVYDHALDFVDRNNNFSQVLKNEFIDDELCDVGKTLDEMFLDVKLTTIIPVNEIKYTFFASVKSQNERMTLTELGNSDFCCIENDDGERFFYVLSVIKKTVLGIEYDAEIDIFFSYNISFRGDAYNSLIQGHVDRWDVNMEPILNNLMNQESNLDVEPALHEQENVLGELNNKMDTATKNIGKKIKWMVVYLKDKSTISINRNEYTVNAQVRKKSSSHCSITGSSTSHAPRICKESDYEVVPGSGVKTYVSSAIQTITGGDGNGSKMSYNKQTLLLPYQILIVPMLEGYEISFNNLKFSPNYFQTFFNDNESIISVHLLDSMPFRFDNYGEITTIKLYDKELKLNGLEKANGGHFNKNGFFVIDDINLIHFDNVEQKAGITTKLGRPILPTNNIISNTTTYPLLKEHNEPKLWHHQFYNVSVKTGNGKNKIYYPFWMKKTQHVGQIKKVYTCQPEVMSELIWFEGIENNDNLHMGNVLNHKVIQEIPTKQLSYVKFMRENKNQLQTGIKYDKQTRAFSWVAAAMSLPALNTVATAGAVYGAIQTQKSLEMRESKLKDIQNIIPNVDGSNNLMMNLYFNKLNKEGIIVSHNYLLKQHKKMVYDYFTTFGYTMKRLENINLAKVSRYRFNFMRTDGDIFNTINNKLSARIKMTISDAFESGITFGHYRNKSTGKGIKTYAFENWEMSVLKRIGKV